MLLLVGADDSGNHLPTGSPSQDLVVYTVHYLGSESFVSHIRHLKLGDDVTLKNTAAGGGGANDLLTIDHLVWGEDGITLYYMTMDEAHQPYEPCPEELEEWELYRHITGRSRW